MNELYVRSKGEVTGPFSLDEIREKIARNELMPLHEVSYDGEAWMRAGRIWDDLVPKRKDSVPPEMARKRTPAASLPQPPSQPQAPAQPRKPETKPTEAKQSSPDTPKDDAPRLEVRKSVPLRPTEILKHEPTQSTLPPGFVHPTPADDFLDEETSLELVPEEESAEDQDERDNEASGEPSTSQEPMIGFRTLRGFSILLGLSTSAVLVCGVLAIDACWETYGRLHAGDARSLRGVSESGLLDRLESFDKLFFTVSVVNLILFLVWIYFTVRYLYRLSYGRMRFTPGWSVGWFLIPIANLWKPYQVVNEIRLRSEKFLNRFDALPPHSSLIQLWWAATIIGVLFKRFLGFYSKTQLEIPGDFDPQNKWHVRIVENLPGAWKQFMAMGIAWTIVEMLIMILMLCLIYRLDSIRPHWSVQARRIRRS